MVFKNNVVYNLSRYQFVGVCGLIGLIIGLLNPIICDPKFHLNNTFIGNIFQWFVPFIFIGCTIIKKANSHTLASWGTYIFFFIYLSTYYPAEALISQYHSFNTTNFIIWQIVALFCIPGAYLVSFFNKKNTTLSYLAGALPLAALSMSTLYYAQQILNMGTYDIYKHGVLMSVQPDVFIITNRAFAVGICLLLTILWIRSLPREVKHRRFVYLYTFIILFTMLLFVHLC